HGELIHVELAEHDGTVIPEIGRYGRFIARLEAIENMARSLGVDPLGREEILYADWNAFERARAIMRQTLIRGFRHFARLVGGHRHIGVELVIRLVDRAKIGLGQFERGKILRRKSGADLGNGVFRNFRHDRPFAAAAALAAAMVSVEVSKMAQPPYSTTFGTMKKLSASAGALATMSAALLPSVTSSPRSRMAMGMTEVNGSTPFTSTSFNCSTKPRMAFSSPVIRSAASSLIAMRASFATRFTVSVSTDIVSLPLVLGAPERRPNRLELQHHAGREGLSLADAVEM